MTASTVHGGEGGVSVTLDEILTVLFFICTLPYFMFVFVS